MHYDEYLKNESAQWREVYRPLSLMAGYTPSYIRYINERMFEEARRDMESLMKGDNKK